MLELLDFDDPEAFSQWREGVNKNAPKLLAKLFIESSPGGGKHVAYRTETKVPGNLTLARAWIVCDGPEEIEAFGKKHTPKKRPDGTYVASPARIETRGEGGVFLCAPSQGYEVEQGDLADLPVITTDERDELVSAARMLDRTPAEVVRGEENGKKSNRKKRDGTTPGDDFNSRGDPRPILKDYGWRYVHTASDHNERWARPGKEHGTSATLKDGIFYCFSENAPPFEGGKAYPPFAVYTLLEHDGDFSAAAKTLSSEGYGSTPKKRSATRWRR